MTTPANIHSYSHPHFTASPSIVQTHCVLSRHTTSPPHLSPPCPPCPITHLSSAAHTHPQHHRVRGQLLEAESVETHGGRARRVAHPGAAPAHPPPPVAPACPGLTCAAATTMLPAPDALARSVEEAFTGAPPGPLATPGPCRPSHDDPRTPASAPAPATLANAWGA